MKIFHVLDRSVPDLSGYSIRSKYIIEFQKRMGMRQFVITSPKYECSPMYQEISEIPYYRTRADVSFVSNLPFVREKVQMNVLYKKICRLGYGLGVKLIHAHSPSLCGLPALHAARKLNIPCVYEMRAFWEDAAVDLGRFREGSFKYRISQYIEGKLLRGADTIVGICEGIKGEVLRRVKRDNVYIVPNGVDSETFRPRDKSDKLLQQYDLSGKVVAGFIGSFFTFEGLQTLIESVPQIVNKNPDVRFLIVGAGVEDENVRKLAKELDVLDKYVIFTGKVPHEEVMDYYSVMDILVYPRISKRITELVTPLKPLEAMAMEKAVVVSDVGGLKELVKDGETGLVFKAGERGDLAERILTLAESPQLRERLGKTARKEVVNNRNWSTIVPKYRDIYTQIIADRKHR